jgi:hypothetical protein
MRPSEILHAFDHEVRLVPAEILESLVERIRRDAHSVQFVEVT